MQRFVKLGKADPKRIRQRIWWHLASAKRLTDQIEGFARFNLMSKQLGAFMTMIDDELSKGT